MVKTIRKWLGLDQVSLNKRYVTINTMRNRNYDFSCLKKRVDYLEQRILVMQYLEIVDDGEVLILLNKMMEKYDEYFSCKLNKKLQENETDVPEYWSPENIGNNLTNDIVKECITKDTVSPQYGDAWKSIGNKLRKYNINNRVKIKVIKEK